MTVDVATLKTAFIFILGSLFLIALVVRGNLCNKDSGVFALKLKPPVYCMKSDPRSLSAPSFCPGG